ncbi:gamma-glutamyltransferase [Chromatiales bacterium (ex Bugula neritina AB1)]|nr:gamma-glutamyltransferase [Chromatiales bacterium (ex Bugula neritina AB1)]
MSVFTTRPELLGTFGVVASTHWIATAVGMNILEKGGNAFDAAVATGFVLQVVEPHLNGPGGDMPAVLYSAANQRVDVICGQGPAPAGATIEHYRSEGLDLIPGDGLLATVIPGAFDGWMLMLRDYGSMRLQDVLEPAIYYAEHGHPVLPRVADTIADMADFFKREWPTSYKTWLPNGTAPSANQLVRNPALASTWKRIISEASIKSDRQEQIELAREAFYRGFVAEEIESFLQTAEVMDASGSKHKGILTADDLNNWSATIEQPTNYNYQGWQVSKTGPWGQGPVLLQSLAILDGIDIGSMDPCGTDFVHHVIETMKLAYADREVYYGDPAFSRVPLEQLLSRRYNDERRALLSHTADQTLRPGTVPGYETVKQQTLSMLAAMGVSTESVYEPTMAHLSEKRGDTVHIDVIDKHGNLVAVTPSGGWLQSSPTIEKLGFCLNSRAQMYWLQPGLPTSLQPGKRPRTTLTSSIAIHEDGAAMAFGTPGGDQQDQWQLAFFLRHVHHTNNLQEAIDQPLFHTMHFPSSFYPRSQQPGHMMIERNFGTAVLNELQARGHTVTVADEWAIGRLTAARRDADGLLRAAATPRLMQAYAAGR